MYVCKTRLGGSQGVLPQEIFLKLDALRLLLWLFLGSMPGGTQPYAWNTSLQALPQRLLPIPATCLLSSRYSTPGFVVCLQPNSDRRDNWGVDSVIFMTGCVDLVFTVN